MHCSFWSRYAMAYIIFTLPFSTSFLLHFGTVWYFCFVFHYMIIYLLVSFKLRSSINPAIDGLSLEYPCLRNVVMQKTGSCWRCWIYIQSSLCSSNTFLFEMCIDTIFFLSTECPVLMFQILCMSDEIK